MSLNLDARQRAMLQEMGHPLWWPESAAPVPQATAEAAQTPVAPQLEQKQALARDQSALAAITTIANPAVEAAEPIPAPMAAEPTPTPVARAEAARPAPAPAPRAPAAPVAVQPLPGDFPRVRFALRAPVLLDLRDPKAQAEAAPAPAATQPAWLVVAELPEGAPPHGKAGQLVTNMLRAMRLTDAPVYWVPLARIAPGQDDADELPSFGIDALVQDTGATMALLLGLPAARHLVGGELPFAALRQQVHPVGDKALPAVVSYDPSHLLRVPLAKRETWADLCFALAQAGR